MKTGDILLCSGNGFLSRQIIRYNKVILHFSGIAAEMSHVAMIGPTDNDVFEATYYNAWSDGGRGRYGVQTNSFLTWLKNYDGDVWVREQKPAMVSEAMRIRMQSRMCQLIGTPYEHGIPGFMELLLAGISIPWLSTSIAQKLRTKNAVHCSEVDGDVLRYARILPQDTRINKIPPCYWWQVLPIHEFYYPAKQIKTKTGKILI